MKNLFDRLFSLYPLIRRTKKFEQCFPRLTIKNSVGAGWEEGEKVALEAPVCVVSIISASTNQKDRTHVPFLGAHSKNSHQHQRRPLVVLAYHQTDFPDSDNDLALILPFLMFSIQINSALEECLSILLKFLHRIRVSSVAPPHTFSPEIVTPLCTILPTIASAHPDPLVRHQTFRIISSVLTLTQSDKAACGPYWGFAAPADARCSRGSR